MGSSLRVTPAADIPLSTAENGGKLVIVNLQKTPLDKHAALVIHAKCDDMMKILMKKLDLEVPEFRLNRRVQFTLDKSKVADTLSINGLDPKGNIYSLFTSVDITAGKERKKQSIRKEPFKLMMKGGLGP
jgi:hypothetical protein